MLGAILVILGIALLVAVNYLLGLLLIVLGLGLGLVLLVAEFAGGFPRRF